MKIGQVSKYYDISIDNLYYYINYGLLVPPRPKGQYVFDKPTRKDLEMILQLKEMDFSLKEIHKIISLYRISGLAAPQDVEDLRSLYREKLLGCNREKARLEWAIDELQKKLLELKTLHPDTNPPTGLPISMLDLLCCPECGGDFEMDNVHMDLKYIFSGALGCNCGYKAFIKEGVLHTPEEPGDEKDLPDLERKLYKDLPPSLISLFQRSYNWMIEKLAHMDLSGKVVMETYINAWFFMHNHQQYLDPAAKYIVVDKYPEMLNMYKGLMDSQLDILYIACNGTWLPLKKGSVDLNIDYFAVNEHNFYFDSFLYEQLLSRFKKDGKLLGTYFYFENGKKSMENLLSEYDRCSPNNFSLPYFLKQMGGHIIDQEDCGFTTSSGANIGFSFHEEGEKMYLRSYFSDVPL